jgi:hypothetical protein
MCSFCQNLNQNTYGGKYRRMFWGKECDGAPQRPLSIATALNMWDLVGCLKLDSLHCHLQSPLAINFSFVTTLILDCQVYTIL